MAKKRKLDDKSLQIEKGRTEDGKNPYKKRRVATKKIKSSKNGVVTVVSCESKHSIRRSSRLATKSQNKQKIEDSAETNFNCLEIVSQPLERTQDHSCTKSKAQLKT